MPIWLLPMFLLLLSACTDREMESAPTTGGVKLGERMAATPDPAFERAYAPRDFEFPRDHADHPGFATEWWYLTGNLADGDDRRFGYQLTLFRIALEPGEPADDSSWRTHQLYMGHVAISDLERERHHSEERFGRAAAGLAGAQAEPFRVWLGPWSISGAGDPFPLHLAADATGFGLALEIASGDKPMVLQGDHGLSRKGAAPGNASYYYSYTRLPTRGVLRLDDREFRVSGNSWLDREWSSSALADDQAGWDWFALQLDDGSDLMFYQMRGLDGAAQPFSRGVLVTADGAQVTLHADDVKLSPMRHWQADPTTRYPVTWRLEVPSRGLNVVVDAAFDEQEMRHTVHYWEGAVRVSGSHSGRGYLELSGYAGNDG